jgi:type I restriction enzyme S subunit
MLSGGTPSKANPQYWGGETPWLSAKDLKSFRLSSAQETVTEAGIANGTRLVPANTLLILVRGMTLHKDVPVGITTRPVTFNQDLKALAVRNETNPAYLAYWLVGHKAELMSLVDHAGHGTGRLTTECLSAVEVNIPPPGEQDRVVKILDTADEAVRTTEALIAAKVQHKQTLAEQLLTGKCRFPEFKGQPWREAKLGDICMVVMGQSPPSQGYNTLGKGLPLIQGNADLKNQRLAPKVWSAEVTRQSQAGDVIMTVRAPVGVVARGQHAACLGRGVCALRAKSINADFLFHSMAGVEPLWNKFGQGSTFTAVNRNDIRQFTICVPQSEEEQYKIADVLGLMDEEIVLLRRQLDALKKQKQWLMQKLLTGEIRVKECAT